MIVRMFPSDANPAGNVFGGEILKQIDLAAGLVAQRHAQANTVTASIDRVNFLKPVYVGNALVVNARLNYASRSSMEIEIRVEAEDMTKNTRTLTGTAFVTVVALDKDGKPTTVPELILETEEDERKFAEGKARMEHRARERRLARERGEHG
ncbi:MAG: acyl-CoA thioesterase [Thaumarchaeota archaeon]|nr:acyl-CoA thioesterase [Nitrososphaerota archaeon]